VTSIDPRIREGTNDVERIAITPHLLASRLVGILRARAVRHVLPVVETLASCGLSCLELTFTIPGMPAVLARLASQLPADVTVGAGTVTTLEQAREAIGAGATFLASPMLCPDVLEHAAHRGVPYYPGAWTATEVSAAWRMGASAVKLFPASSGGVAHLRQLREPFREIAFLPTGGVDAASATEYLRAGAIGVGVGGRLIGDALEGGDLAALAARTRELMTAVRPG
jgi:2-dehydro-3-deoxyphosphogluconate aldolase / (4S)-4-hydroxy-2-oxoglutarate aldolase